MKRAMLVCAAVGALSLLGASAAEAGGYRIGFNFGGHGNHYGHGHHYGHRNYGYNRGYQRGYFSGGYYGSPRSSHFGRSYYHDTSHYDYHPGTYVPHGNHLHYVPGHYDYHRTGHLHYR